ncbi:MAG: ABC transporter substrate-binding protein, partial [Flammeovirgaceae bacterium]
IKLGQAPAITGKLWQAMERLRQNLESSQKHWQAIEVFRRLSKTENGMEIYLNSIYFHARSLYKVNKKQEARQLLFLLADKYSSWGSIDEVYYLMAMIDFDWKSPVDALDHLSKIKNESIKKDAHNLKKAKLSEDTIERLKYLYAKYPEDKAIGKVLLTKLYEVGGGPNMALLEELQDKYNAEKTEKIDTNNPVLKRDSYNVAVLLPFKAKSISAVPQSNFVLELYEGIQLGLENLEKQGIKLNLYTYDTKRDSATTAKLLVNTDMLNMDLIIGPLYGNTLPLVQKFSLENQIPFVNPISDNSLIIKDHPYGFLLSSGYETIAKSVASYASEQLKGKEAVVIHGSAVKDTLTAEAFQKHVELNGGKVLKKVTFTGADYAYNNLVNDLSALRRDTGKYYVYIASNDVVLGRTSLSALQNLLFEGAVFAPYRWLEVDQISYTRMESSKVKFVSPMCFDENKDAFKQFRSDYLKKVKMLPSKFAIMGYETISYFGMMLNNFGVRFTDSIHDENNPITSTLFDQLHYMGGNDNQHVNILQFENGVLRVVNQKEGMVDKEK